MKEQIEKGREEIIEIDAQTILVFVEEGESKIEIIDK